MHHNVMHANNVYLHNNVLCMLRHRYGLVIDEDMCRPPTHHCRQHLDSLALVYLSSVSPEESVSSGAAPGLLRH